MPSDKLFAPYTIKSLEIKNRIVLPPLVRFGWSAEGAGLVACRECKRCQWYSEPIRCPAGPVREWLGGEEAADGQRPGGVYHAN